MTRTFKLTIAYDGTDFAGWQIQPGQTTIQGMLERALVKITKQRVQVTGSGRTDAGVHAIAQVASCSIDDWRATASDLARAINTHLPETIVVRDAEDAPDGFHAIRDAVGKRYRYQLQIGGMRDAFDYRYRWHVRGPIDRGRMREAAKLFVGRHDFASFQAAGGKTKTTVREIRCCQWVDQPSSSDQALRCAIEVEADGFLYNMVRNIVGTLIEVGRGKQPVNWINEVIAACDRTAAGPTAPPQGLFLQRVDYAAKFASSHFSSR